jgi:hypothetical protein
MINYTAFVFDCQDYWTLLPYFYFVSDRYFLRIFIPASITSGQHRPFSREVSIDLASEALAIVSARLATLTQTQGLPRNSLR